MKKKNLLALALAGVLAASMLTACGSAASDPGAPPQEVLEPSTSQTAESNTEAAAPITYTGELRDNVTTVRVGQANDVEHAVAMYDNAAVATMLDYLATSETLFPSSIYEGDAGYVAHNIRGSYTRDDEMTVADVHAGEMYLFSDGQLRLYFMDAPGANITATPVGVFDNAENLADEVETDHAANTNDPWNVEVYFWITKNA